MGENRMAPPKADERLSEKLARASFERCKAENRAAAAGGYLWQTEVVGDGYDRESGTPHFDAALNQRERDGWELVGMVREDGGTTRLVYRRRAR